MFKKHSTVRLVAAAAMLFGGPAVAIVASSNSTAGAASSTTTFLAASNTEPAFNFMAQSFIQNDNGGKSVTFSFGGSGGLAGKIDGGVDFAANGSGNSPTGFSLFASADEANVDNTIPEGSTATSNTGSIPRFTVGQCIDTHSSTYSSANGGNNQGSSCPGIGSTRAQYTTGRLVVFSCKSGGQTLAPAENAPTCAQPVSGYFAVSGKNEAPSTMPQVWTDLLAHTAKADGGTNSQNIGGYLAIADPKNGWVFSSTACGPSPDVAPNAPYGLAGMEALYVSAVEYYAARPRPSLGKTSSEQACAEINRMTDGGTDLDNYSTTSPSSGGQNGGGNYSDPTLPIIFGDNVTYTQDTVVAGTSQIALLPKSFVVSPSVDDTNFWAEVPDCGVSSAAKATVTNGWTVSISGAERCTDQDYVKGMHDSLKGWISSRDFGKNGVNNPKTLVGQHGYYQPIRQWVVVENDDAGQSTTADLSTPDGEAATAFIQYLLSPTGQSVLAHFGYDPIS